MKNLSLILFFAIIASSSIAQELSTDQKNQFSINGSSFIKNFMSLNSNAAPSQTYQFMYRRFMSNGNAVRAQFGLAYFQSSEEEDDDSNVFRSSANDFSLGFEKRTQISKRWLYYFGGQALLQYSVDKSENSSGTFQSIDEELRYGIGIGAIVGLQFNINDRISLGTEGGLPIVYTVATSKQTFSSETVESKMEFVSLQATLPSSLYLNITF
jgi:hypothetical protein